MVNIGCFPSEGSTKLKEHLIDDLDYALVPAEGWDKLFAWYGMVDGQVGSYRICLLSELNQKPFFTLLVWDNKLL